MTVSMHAAFERAFGVQQMVNWSTSARCGARTVIIAPEMPGGTEQTVASEADRACAETIADTGRAGGERRHRQRAQSVRVVEAPTGCVAPSRRCTRPSNCAATGVHRPTSLLASDAFGEVRHQ